ncbi:toll/interleukin-1 receptor domain-containing protein [Pedococcus sp. KACC 23699]|uniref:Toll/interleukin-1 receptor domain-containing protein n=1 Tax=Pedococcus sp. KACC 23699 TaxID=3149228 RepID=A0AAU7JVH6_9MICO
MAQCTAPVRGHRSPAAAADCPACGGRSRYGSSYSSYSSYGGSSPYGSGRGSTYGAPSSGGSTSRRTRTGRSVSYSPSEWRAVEPYAEKAAEQARAHPERRDLFLCHAWDDRQGSAADLNRLLKANGASVWFSEEDIPLGSLMIREIDKGLRNSRIGIVLVTPALIKSINNEGIAEKELAVLLASRRVVPVMHGVTFDELNDVSTMLASHAGLSTATSSLDDVAAKLAAAAAALPVA